MELNYRDTLKQEFEERRSRNSSYSIRAFARDLDMAPSKLSEVIRGKVGLSRNKAEKVASRLALDPDARELFISGVEKEHSRSPVTRALAQEKLNQLVSRLELTELELEKFKILTDWHHYGLMELTERKDYVSDVNWMAEKLDLKTDVVVDALKRLEKLGLMKKDKCGRWFQTEADLVIGNGLPSSAIRKYHRQILSKAESILETCSVDERDFSSGILVIEESQIPKAKEMLKKFRHQFYSEFTKTKIKDRVYCLGIQFFPMDKK